MPKERKRKAEENNKYVEEDAPQLSEVILKILLGRKIRILKVLLVSTIIKKIIMPTNVWS